MSSTQTNHHDDDGDTAREPTVQEIDEIYNFLITSPAVLYDELNPKIERMLLTLDRVSNSINRREEQEEQDEEEEENKCEPDRCDAVGLCSLDKCYYESDEDEDEEETN